MKFSSWNRRTVAWVGGLFIAAIVALAAHDIVEGYHRTVANTGRELDAQARLIAEQTARSLQAVDVVLRHLAQQHRLGAFEAMGPKELHNYLREQAVGLVQVEGVGIIDADGNPSALSMAHPLPPTVTNVADLEIFRALKAGHRGLFVGDALKVPDGRWVVPLGRRIDSLGGGFAGAAAARGRIEYFEHFYRNVQLDPSTAITLARSNGTLLARHPPVEAAFGKRLPMFDQLMATNGPMRAVSSVDGVERIGVLKLVPDYPLAVIVTRDVAAVLAPWRAQSTGTALRTLALSALAAVLLALLLRQLSRLQTTQERYALAVAGSDDGVWEYDFVRKRVFASARAREISGLPPGPEMQSIDEWNAQLKIHPEDAPRRRAAQDAHLRGETPAYEGEFRMLHPDGKYRWLRIHGLCSRDAAGRPTRMAGSTSDIDARRRAEEALRASEEQYKAVYNGTTDALILRDAEGRIVDVNPAFLEMNGMTREQALSERTRIFAPEHKQDMVRELHRRARAGETVHYQLEVERKQGEHAHLDVRIVPVLYRGEVHSLSLARDITVQKRVEDALKSSEEQYRSIFNAAADALVLRDAEARVVDVNPAFLALSGFTREEVVGRKRWIFAAPEQSVLAAQMHRRVIAGESVQAEIQARRKDGRAIDVEMRAVPIRYRGEPHALGMARDITAQKEAAAARARLEGQLLQAKKLEAIGTLAGGIAHDFNNILAAILGYGDMAQRKAAEGTPLKRHIDAVVAAGLRAKSLVERILAFSRSGTGVRTPVHVQAVVTEALDLLAASLPKHVRLERRLQAGEATVMGDATQIHQVVMNLCANAVQAMKARSAAQNVLTVALEGVERGEAMAATSRLPAGRYLQLAVRDTGSGIAPQVLERIFDPFFTTREVGVGTGLGLSLVHGIVTELGGGIDVESKPGAGTTFTVYLPRSSSQVVPAQGDEEVPQGEGEAILLVDDEEALVRLGEEMLAELGYEPVGFTSSAAALEAFRESPERFQAVLSDEAMADMTGAELAKAIRALRPEMPIVLMSGYVSPLFAARARAIGVAEVLAKPLVARDIARSLWKALRENKEKVR
jgi:PAS domain S-box-containing protein